MDWSPILQLIKRADLKKSAYMLAFLNIAKIAQTLLAAELDCVATSLIESLQGGSKLV